MKKQYDIVGNRKKFFIFSAVLIVFILLFSVIFGVEMDPVQRRRDAYLQLYG